MSPRYFFMNSLCEFPFSKGRADNVMRQHPRTRFREDADDLVYSSVEGMEQSHAGALSVWPQYNGQSYNRCNLYWNYLTVIKWQSNGKIM